eukprot:TRINITY_DN703_c0_g1_i4.p1 TRINITY_DN703_c0_g1~~TRINITY_DN703_c0_g1_i4.p1  ORF type:complete len:232 (+),score=-10.64 TRINITY_DN703_c0_g1_i4:324-1019(+)
MFLYFCGSRFCYQVELYLKTDVNKFMMKLQKVQIKESILVLRVQVYFAWIYEGTQYICTYALYTAGILHIVHKCISIQNNMYVFTVNTLLKLIVDFLQFGFYIMCNITQYPGPQNVKKTFHPVNFSKSKLTFGSMQIRRLIVTQLDLWEKIKIISFLYELSVCILQKMFIFYLVYINVGKRTCINLLERKLQQSVRFLQQDFYSLTLKYEFIEVKICLDNILFFLVGELNL